MDDFILFSVQESAFLVLFTQLSLMNSWMSFRKSGLNFRWIKWIMTSWQNSSNSSEHWTPGAMWGASVLSSYNSRSLHSSKLQGLLRKIQLFGSFLTFLAEQIHELEVRYMTAEKVRLSFKHYLELRIVNSLIVTGYLSFRPVTCVACAFQLLQGLLRSEREWASEIPSSNCVSFCQDLSTRIGELFRLLDTKSNGTLNYVELQVPARCS